MISNITKFFEKQPKSYITTISFLMVVYIGFLDYVTGPEIAFSLFYLLPIFLSAWFAEKDSAIFVSLVSGLSWFIAQSLWEKHYKDVSFLYWESIATLIVFLIFAHLLSRFKKTLENEIKLTKMDSLTGTLNIKGFYNLYINEVERARRYKHPITITYIDIDDFKDIINKHGHITGDTLINIVAETIKENVRSIDIVGRVGGDEFIVLLPETAPESIHVIINRLHEALLNAMRLKGWNTTFSIGVASFVDPTDTINNMIKKADELMYSIKNSGKNAIKYGVFDKNLVAIV